MPGAVSAAHPRWLRLTRSGDMITGYDSADGRRWIPVGTVRLTGLPSTVQVGMFAASPFYSVTQNSFGGNSNAGGPAQATGVFDHVSLTARASSGTWTGTTVGGGGPAGAGPGGGSAPFTRNAGRYTLTGSGDIAPVTPGPDSPFPTVTIEQSLVGAFLGLIVIVVVAAMFFSTEYRRGLIRTTLAATPRRGAVLAAKAVVIGAVAFVTGLMAAVISIAVGVPKEENQGPDTPDRARADRDPGQCRHGGHAGRGRGSFAVALGAILRRSAAAITIAVVAGHHAVPKDRARWPVPAGDRRLAAAADPGRGPGDRAEHPPVLPGHHRYLACVRGYRPSSPYAGFAVLCLWRRQPWPRPWSCCGGGTHECRRRRSQRRSDGHGGRSGSGSAPRRCTPSGPSCARSPDPPAARVAALTIAVSAAAAGATRCPQNLTCPVDTTKLSLTGIQFGPAGGRDPGRADGQQRVQLGHDARHPRGDAQAGRRCWRPRRSCWPRWCWRPAGVAVSGSVCWPLPPDPARPALPPRAASTRSG